MKTAIIALVLAALPVSASAFSECDVSCEMTIQNGILEDMYRAQQKAAQDADERRATEGIWDLVCQMAQSNGHVCHRF
jgi:invasion protein IalB